MRKKDVYLYRLPNGKEVMKSSDGKIDFSESVFPAFKDLLVEKLTSKKEENEENENGD